MMKIFRILTAIALVFTLASCGKNSVDPKNPKSKEFELYIDFWNTQGTNPQITFDAVNSSPEVKIDFSKTFEGITVPPKYTNVIIDNVRIIDKNDVNYQIDGITAYEFRNDINDWKVDVEFTMQYTQVQDLMVMMVLDASASLGSDIDKVKQYASNFITKVLTEIPNARIGVIDFSDEIHSFPPTNNKVALQNYIASIQQGPFTSLYEAVNMGIDILNNGQAEGKALLVFTDGTDNNSNPEFTPEYLLDKLKNTGPNGHINSFTIGLNGNGGVDKPVLEALAANSGNAAFPNNIDELGSVFERFSGSISNVYNLTYVRNQQVIPDSNKARLRFVIKGTPKTE
ncbi:MAG: vWA domain-containing protein [Saprospiraceae bacterium]